MVGHCISQCSVGFRAKSLRTYCPILPSTIDSKRLAATVGSIEAFRSSLMFISLRIWRSCVSILSNSWLTLTLSLSVSPASGSPVRILVIPGFSSQKVKISLRIFSQRLSAICSSIMILEIRENKVSSMNWMRVSNIFALLGKCLYKAASDTPTWSARTAVVMRAPGFCSRIVARDWSIWSFRDFFCFGKRTCHSHTLSDDELWKCLKYSIWFAGTRR